MEKIIVIIITLITVTSVAQVPQAFSFQGLASNENGSAIADKTISIEVAILQGSATGSPMYKERHLTTTNKNGLYTLSIGIGQTVSGKFNEINWSELPMFLSISIDPAGGTNYKNIGTTQLLSVPYALKAGNADIRPEVYVRQNPTYTVPKITNGEAYNALGSISYSYQWIHGKPENVLVEFEGLPDNVNIYTNAMGGVGLPSTIVNSSKVDTIIDGILTRQSFFGVKPSTSVPKGKYPLKINFKIKNETLASLPYDLIVRNNLYEDCFPTLPKTYTLKSNSCPELDTILVKNILAKANTTATITLTNIFNGSKTDVLNYTYSTANCVPSSSFYDSATNGLSILQRIFEKDGNKIVFRFQYSSFVQQNLKACVVTYE
jgi:hypothetical protein